jgi:hypothetical protein
MFKTNQLGFNSPARRHPERPGEGFEFGFEILPAGGTTGLGLAPVDNGNVTGELLQIFCAMLHAFETGAI